MGEEIKSCLRNERVIVRYLKKGNNFIKHPDHIAYGGLLDSANIYLTLGVHRNGSYIDPFTEDERIFLEKKLTLEPKILSPHNKEYWDNYYVMLSKHDVLLDMADPIDYVKLKVLESNKNLVAPNLDALTSGYSKASYRYVIINQGDEDKKVNASITKKKKCYMLYGKMDDNRDKLVYVQRAITGRSSAKNTKIATLSAAVGQLIETETDTFYRICSDNYFDTKVLIDKGVKLGAILRRDGEHYTPENKPLCEKGENPTLEVTAKYLNQPEYQEIKFAIETRIDNARE